MESLRDERVVMTVLRTFEEFFRRELGIKAVIEAFGPSMNEGYCYESAIVSEYSGEISGRFVFAMDGYTRLKLLPNLGDWYYDNIGKDQVSSSVAQQRFVETYLQDLTEELEIGELSCQFQQPVDLSHKINSIPLKRERQFILIYFLKDEKARTYMGRAYLILTISRFSTQQDDSPDK